MRLSKPILIALAVWSVAAGARAQTWVVTSTGQEMRGLGAGGVGASELSGLTWAGGSQYYAVSDDGGRMFPLTIQIHPDTGQILSATLAPAITLAGGSDLEGIAYDAINSSVFVSDEAGPAIREHSIADGSLLQTVSVPSIFATHRTNLSLESLTLQSGGAALWTANEEALSGDGPVSSFSTGTVVRLQKFDAALNPIGQWAYVTDAISGDLGNNGRDIEVSGVADLMALPSGELVVLERALGATPFGFRMRLYMVDLDAATDITALPSLVGETYTPAAKTFLWQSHFAGFNLEGIALGPQLSNGGYSVIVVADNGGGTLQGLYSLSIRFIPPLCSPTPLAGCRTAEHSGLRFSRKDGERDKLMWNWRGGTVENLGVYGDPITAGGTAYTMCVYDSSGGVPNFTWGARVEAGTPWSEAGERGFRYRDHTGAAGGLTNILLRTGDGNARIVLRGKGLNLQPPDNGANPLLNLDTSVTVQLVNDDDPARCFEASYSEAQESTPDLFKARF